MSSWTLLLTPIVPDPSGAGLARRAWSWVAELSRSHRLTILVIGPSPQSLPVNGLLPGKVVFSPTRTTVRKSGRLADWVYSDDVISANLTADLPATKPSRVVIFRLYLHEMQSLLPHEWNDITELDCDDLESRTRISLASLAMRRMRFRDAFAYFESALGYAKIESSIPFSYRKVYISAPEDAKPLMARNRATNIVIRPNKIVRTAPCHDTKRRHPLSPPSVLFVGSMGYLPNEDAALLIAGKIAPLLKRRLPEVDIAVAGGIPHRLDSILQESGIRSLGVPTDFSSAYANSTVVIAPLRGGGGTKMKVLEAWLHRRPLVSTRHAARGLEAIHGKHLLIAERPAEFVDCCIRLINQPALAEDLANQAHDHLMKRFLI